MGNIFKTGFCVLVALIVLAGAAFWGLAGLMPAVDIEDSLRPDAASHRGRYRRLAAPGRCFPIF